MDVGKKRCTKCGAEKSITEFYCQKEKRDGRQANCKACNGVSHKRSYLIRAKRKREAKAVLKEQSREERAARRRKFSREATRRWYAANRKKVRGRAAEYRKNNLDKERNRNAAYAKANPDKMRAKCHKRRARILGSGEIFTSEDVKTMLRLQRRKCAACRVSIRQHYHVDHVKPLSLGGSNSVKNIQLLCPSCNHKKGARDPIEFMQSAGRLL